MRTVRRNGSALDHLLPAFPIPRSDFHLTLSLPFTPSVLPCKYPVSSMPDKQLITTYPFEFLDSNIYTSATQAVSSLIELLDV